MSDHAVPPWSFRARFVQLILGVALYGVSAALLVLSGLGLDPWDVFHQGVAERSSIPIGVVTIIVGFLVLALWIPLRQRPGLGTICNAFGVGATMDLVLALVAPPRATALRWSFLAAGILLNGIATGAYIGAAMGPGPRDGLMVGIARRGHSIRIVRTVIEVLVLIVGYLLGGTVGIGTVLYALCIGPLAHVTIPAFARVPAVRSR